MHARREEEEEEEDREVITEEEEETGGGEAWIDIGRRKIRSNKWRRMEE